MSKAPAGFYSAPDKDDTYYTSLTQNNWINEDKIAENKQKNML